MPAAKAPSRKSAKPTTAKAAKPAKTVDPVVATSVRALADLVGRAHTAVNRWVKDDRWRFGPGPWKASDVVRIQQWMAAELVERPATAELRSAELRGTAVVEPRRAGDSLDDLSISKKADVALKIKRREVLDFGLQVQQGKYHATEACQQRMLKAIHEVRQGLLNLPESMPLDADSKTMLRGRCVELLRRFREGLGMASVSDVGSSG